MGKATCESCTEAPVTTAVTGSPQSVTSRCSLYPFQNITFPWLFFLHPQLHCFSTSRNAAPLFIESWRANLRSFFSGLDSPFLGLPRPRFRGGATSDLHPPLTGPVEPSPCRCENTASPETPVKNSASHTRASRAPPVPLQIPHLLFDYS